ncbi:MAG: SHIRT domain-containing protein [Anaerococcus vaginalis]|nr:SHIRT domain-containing protein [Anaerococcus vaginalis]
MRRENKNPRKILFSVLIAIAFVVLAGIKLAYAHIISQKQGINEYHFYNDTIENKDSAKEIQKQIVLDGKSISDPGHVFKDKDKVLLKWQDEEGNDIKFDTPIEIKGNDKKIINVYPVFKNQVVITYYIPGSTNDRVYMTDTISDASSYKLPVDPTIYDANKYFVNWSTSKDGSTGVYNEESLKKDIAAGKTDIKLYAITEFKHKATFITGDGASFQDQILASKDSKLDKMPEDPTRAGYEFSHWSLTEDGDPVDLNTLVLDKDINVYAVWKPVVVDYKFKVMVQNINDDGYTFHEIISARGLNGEKTSLPFKGSENPDPKVAPSGPIVEDIAKLTEKDGRFNDSYNSKDENGKMDHTYSNPQTLDYLGFHLNEEKTKQAFETIKADGSTVVPVYMDRNVHTIWVYKNASGTSYYQANWVNATDENGNIHVDLRYGQSSDQWFYQLNKDYIYYKDKSIGSFYTKAPVMGDKDVYMYRVYAKGQGFQLRFVEWDPSKFNAQINSGSLDQLKATLGTMKEIGDRVKFENTEHYVTYYGRNYRVFEPSDGMWASKTNTWVDETDHVDDIKGFQPKTGDMSADGLQSVNVNNPAFRDYMFTPKGYGGYFNYTGTKYIDNGSYVGFLFYERKTYNIIYYSGNKKLASNPYKYEADTSDFGLNYKIGETTNPDNPNQVFMGWYEDSTFSVEHKHENGAKMPAHDITVYAKWDSRQYEVTFHTNQDDYERDIEKITEIPEDDTLYDGKYKDDKVSEENFPQPVKPEGARAFLGWYEKNENNRFVKANLHKPIKNNDTHLYAKWKYDYLELKYDLNLPDTDKVEGTAPTDSNSYINDAKALAADVGDVKVNDGKKVFVGWSETKDGSSGLILPSETVLMDKNKTLYAQWKEIPDLPTTKVTYDANGGVGDQHVVDEIITNDFHKVLGNGEGEKINYTREGYVFKGWNRDKNATKAEFQKDDEVTVTSLDESKNNYIYAIWAPIINYTTDGNGQVKEGENFVDNTKEEVELKSNPKGTDTKAKEGYKFSHWTADKEITLNDGTKIPAGEKITDEQLKQAVITEPLTFKANFVKDAPNEFNVRHEFKVSEDSPIKEMPADVKTAVDAQLPEDKKAEDGSVVKPTAPTQIEVKDTENDGTWKFEGFKDQDKTTDEVDAKVNGADVKFEGEWKFTPNEHEVTYEYVSGTEGKELPEALKAKAPEKVTSKVKGDKVTSPVPTGDEATFRDEANKGTWTFKSYDKNDVIISNKDEKVTGTWEFTPDPEPGKHNVKHEFVSATQGKDLPQAVKDLIPKDQTGKADGSTVKPTEPEKTKVADTENDGTWTFEGYKDQDKETPEVDAKVNGADVTFEGKWKFTPNKHKVTYEYVSGTKGKELPAELKAKAPEKVTGKVKGDKVTSPVPTGDEATFRDEANKGTWKFKSFDKNSVEISNQDEKVTGTWVFTPDPEYKVEHKFVSSTKGKDLPKAVTDLTPVQQTGKKDGETVTPTAPKETKVEDKTNDGTWTFEGYDENSKTINKSDVTFEGKWKFTPNKHNVTHKFVSKDPNKKLPQEVLDLLPANQTGKVKGDVVKPTEPKTKEVKVKDGTWKFVSYDKDNKTVEDKDVEFTGTWEFIPDVVTEYVDENGKTIAPKENGTKDKKDIDGYEFVKTEKDDKGNTKHIYKKKVTPPADVVTEYVDEDGNTIAPKENGKQTNKDIDGYEFVRTEKDDKGNTKHIYKKKTTPSPSIVTKFVDEKGNPLAKNEDGKQDKKDIPGYQFVETKNDKDGNVVHVYKLIPSSTVETRYVDTEGNQILADKAGTHDPSNIEGYQFVKTEKDEKGNTVHIYKKIAPVPKVETRYVDENGNQLLPPKEGTQNQVNIDGYDYVSTNKDNNGNTIHVYKKKPIQDVETRYVDTEGNQILADKAGTHDPSTIEGYQFVRTEKDEKGNTRHIYQKLAPVQKVETRYVDENGNQLLPPKEGTQNQVNIDGYDYISTNKDNNGNTIHVYKKKVITPDVVTKYVDENGNEIADTQKGKHPSKNIEGYEIITTKSDEKGNIIYVYRKKPDPTKVVTKFVDEKGNPIAENEDGKKPKKDIKGYEFVKTETDKYGNTIHIYKKKENTPKVVTKFVDEKGNPIAENEDGKKPNKDIKGYEFVKTETDKNGNTIHIYKKSSSEENKYKVTHKFESSTPGKSLPKEILDLLPKNQDGIENGRKVSPTKPSKLEVKVKDGIWVFEGYDKDSSVVNNKDVNFTGKWKFVPNKIGKVKVLTGTNSRSKSNVKTGIEGSSNLIFVLIGSAFALYKNKKNKY